ncbi:galactose-3-O-sulfotransferase 3-like isoform X1 [Branchiostoma floridae]|uniref:Galactose-3-O-sulfotransferase 3-like isoform X1 n=1 Tax=Branchiostoma floridae TaxID=7739 RepID=A0A9J7MRU0_BRAFL|nr:galactose-3-O-sulfotransferase 3-like isoform X1 [Branchiostoma floridae]
MARKRDLKFFSFLMIFMVMCISLYLVILSQPKSHGHRSSRKHSIHKKVRPESQPIPSLSPINVADHQPYPRCTEKKRIALLKNHKVGGDTVKNILNRYGYNKNLTFLIPRNFAPSLAYPYNLNQNTVIGRPPNKTYDIWVHHAVFERNVFKEYFPEDTVFLTILRNPLTHFKSVWNHYQLRKKFGIPTTRIDSILMFLQEPAKYDPICGHGSHEPLCFTQNSMAADLGFLLKDNQKLQSLKSSKARKAMAQAFVRKIQEDFPFVMIMEYFDESLVLLRRMMCWSMKDILYYSVNSKRYSYKHVEIQGEDKDRHEEWNYVDYALYDHFNKTFWQKVSETGNSFREEVAFFQQVNQKMRDHCTALIQKSQPCSRYGATLEVSDTQWGPGFTVDREFCLLARRGLRCHFTLQAERLTKALGIRSRELQQGTRNEVERELNRYCNYCKLKIRCNKEDYLAHFYREGYISAKQYEEFKKITFPELSRSCSLPPTVLRPPKL